MAASSSVRHARAQRYASVTDRATGLRWAKADSGQGMDWGAALAWVDAGTGVWVPPGEFDIRSGLGPNRVGRGCPGGDSVSGFTPSTVPRRPAATEGLVSPQSVECRPREGSAARHHIGQPLRCPVAPAALHKPGPPGLPRPTLTERWGAAYGSGGNPGAAPPERRLRVYLRCPSCSEELAWCRLCGGPVTSPPDLRCQSRAERLGHPRDRPSGLSQPSASQPLPGPIPQLLESHDLQFPSPQPQDAPQLAFADVALPLVEGAGEVAHDRGAEVEGAHALGHLGPAPETPTTPWQECRTQAPNR